MDVEGMIARLEFWWRKLKPADAELKFQRTGPLEVVASLATRDVDKWVFTIHWEYTIDPATGAAYNNESQKAEVMRSLSELPEKRKEHARLKTSQGYAMRAQEED